MSDDTQEVRKLILCAKKIGCVHTEYVSCPGTCTRLQHNLFGDKAEIIAFHIFLGTYRN